MKQLAARPHVTVSGTERGAGAPGFRTRPAPETARSAVRRRQEAEMAEQKILVVMVDEDHETTRTRRFREEVAPDDEPLMGSLYLPKRTLRQLGSPRRIEVEVRPA